MTWDASPEDKSGIQRFLEGPVDGDDFDGRGTTGAREELEKLLSEIGVSFSESVDQGGWEVAFRYGVVNLGLDEDGDLLTIFHRGAQLGPKPRRRELLELWHALVLNGKAKGAYLAILELEGQNFIGVLSRLTTRGLNRENLEFALVGVFEFVEFLQEDSTRTSPSS